MLFVISNGMLHIYQGCSHQSSIKQLLTREETPNLNVSGHLSRNIISMLSIRETVHKDKLEYDFMISEGVGYILTAAE